MILQQLYQIHKSEREFWGEDWCGPVQEFPAGEWMTREAWIDVMAMPARFYRIRFEGHILQTGSSMAELAHALVENMLVIDKEEE